MRDDAKQNQGASAPRCRAHCGVVHYRFSHSQRRYGFRRLLDCPPTAADASGSIRAGASVGDGKAAWVQGASAADYAQSAVGCSVCAAAWVLPIFHSAKSMVGRAARDGGAVGSGIVEDLCEAETTGLGSLAGHSNICPAGCGAGVGADRAFDSSGDQLVFVRTGAWVGWTRGGIGIAGSAQAACRVLVLAGNAYLERA